MKKIIQKFLPIFTAFLMGFSLIAPALSAAPAYASDKPQTAILTQCADEEASNGNGAGITCVIRTVINILSVLVGIVGIIGVVIVGIQYLTASGNEEQTRKAKRRLYEIIIGVAIYVLIAAVLNWLLPNFT